jgi:hypothetical protein
MNNFKNSGWLVDYCPASNKGEIIRIRDDKRFYFSKNIGLPGVVPAYIREKAKQMVKGLK